MALDNVIFMEIAAAIVAFIMLLLLIHLIVSESIDAMKRRFSRWRASRSASALPDKPAAETLLRRDGKHAVRANGSDRRSKLDDSASSINRPPGDRLSQPPRRENASGARRP